MSFLDVKEKMSSKIHNLEGANLEAVEGVSFRDLYMIEDDDRHNLTAEQRECILSFQEKFEELWNKAEESTVTPLEIENGKLPNGVVKHSTLLNMDAINNISQSGIMASEWFGVFESEREGAFCTFLTEKMDMPNPVNQMVNSRSFIVGDGITFFVDTQNEFMQELLSMDYFDYVYKKNTQPDEVQNYPELIRNFYDKVVEPFSPASKTFHNPARMFYAWKAIPGGIPSTLINGIAIHSKNVTPELLSQLSDMFPNANIYNENYQLIGQAPVLNQNFKSDCQEQIKE